MFYAIVSGRGKRFQRKQFQMHKKNDKSTRNLGFDTDFSRISGLFSFFHTGTIVIEKITEMSHRCFEFMEYLKNILPSCKQNTRQKLDFIVMQKNSFFEWWKWNTFCSPKENKWTMNSKWKMILNHFGKVKHSVQAFIYFCLLRKKKRPAIRRKGVGNVQITTILFQSICKASKSNGFDKCFKKKFTFRELPGLFYGKWMVN